MGRSSGAPPTLGRRMGSPPDTSAEKHGLCQNGCALIDKIPPSCILQRSKNPPHTYRSHHLLPRTGGTPGPATFTRPPDSAMRICINFGPALSGAARRLTWGHTCIDGRRPLYAKTPVFPSFSRKRCGIPRNLVTASNQKTSRRIHDSCCGAARLCDNLTRAAPPFACFRRKTRRAQQAALPAIAQ
jgi:hypothetical protein